MAGRGKREKSSNKLVKVVKSKGYSEPSLLDNSQFLKKQLKDNLCQKVNTPETIHKQSKNKTRNESTIFDVTLTDSEKISEDEIAKLLEKSMLEASSYIEECSINNEHNDYESVTNVNRSINNESWSVNNESRSVNCVNRMNNVNNSINNNMKTNLNIYDEAKPSKEEANPIEKTGIHYNIEESDHRKKARKLVEEMNNLIIGIVHDTGHKDECMSFSGKLSELYEIIVQQNILIEKQRSNIQPIQVPQTTEPSFAQITACNINKMQNEKMIQIPKEHTLLVFPQSETQLDNNGARDLLKKIQREINPRNLKIGIKDCRIIRGGVLVKTHTKEDLKLIEDAINENEILRKEVKTKPQEKKKPRIFIRNVPIEFSSEYIKGLLRDQNGWEEGSFQIQNSIKRERQEICHWIVEVSALLFNKIGKKGYLHLDWSRCPFKEYINILQCYSCFRFGHTASRCENKKVCIYCGSSNHKSPECERITSRCFNCKFNNAHKGRNDRTDH